MSGGAVKLKNDANTKQSIGTLSKASGRYEMSWSRFLRRPAFTIIEDNGGGDVEQAITKHEDIPALLRTINTFTPDKDTMAQVRRYFEAHPPGTRQKGIARHALELALNQMKNGAIIETSRAAANVVRTELGYESASVIEQMLIDHIVLTWVNVHHIECVYHAAMGESLSHAQGVYWEKRLDMAHRRYLRAIATLARVRQMRLPPVQLNIARTQMNITSGG